MRVGFLITARMKSTRLPKKLSLKVNNQELIVWMIKRLKQCKYLDEIIIATSTNPQDDILCEIARKQKIEFYRGSEDDVLHRLYHAAKEYEIDYITNVTADCPLVSYDLIEETVELYKKSNPDLITIFNLPHGFYFYAIKISALEKVLEIKDDTDTEVWGRYFTDTGLFKVIDMEIPQRLQRKNYRLTLDYPDDYKFFKALFDGLGPDTYKKSSRELIEFLDRHPEIVRINQHCEKFYRKRWSIQSKIVLK